MSIINKDNFLNDFSFISSLDELKNIYYKYKTQDLVKYADSICRKVYGNKVFLRGLIEFSNICSCDCLYCGIRKSNKNVNRYMLSNDEIEKIIIEGIGKGFKTFVLQSGENENIIPDKISKLLLNLRKKITDDIAITLSCGVYSKDVYKQWKKLGAKRYLLRFETSDEDLYSKLCPTKSLQNRLKALTDLKSCGYEVGSGFMVGLAGETLEIRLRNLLLCKEFGFDMVGIGPFIPNSNTPLKDEKPLNIEETIKMTALLRILLPYANIPATTASGTLDPFGREKMLSSGANVLMPNITPKENKKEYLLYDNKICIDEDGYQCIGCLNSRVKTIGKEISFERGDSKSWELRYALG